MSSNGWAGEYCVGDIVIATVNRPENNQILKKGDTGRVARVGNNAVLVDWFVKPDSKHFHVGNQGDFKLPESTGWWIYTKSFIERAEEDKPFDTPGLDALFV